MKTNFKKIGFNHSVWTIIAVCLLFVSGNVWGLTQAISVSDPTTGSYGPTNGVTISGTVAGSNKTFNGSTTSNLFKVSSTSGTSNTITISSTSANIKQIDVDVCAATSGTSATPAFTVTISSDNTTYTTITSGISISGGATGTTTTSGENIYVSAYGGHSNVSITFTTAQQYVRIVKGNASNTKETDYKTVTVYTESSTPRTFKSGDKIYFKDAWYTAGNSSKWKISGGDLCAQFYDDAATPNTAWVTCGTNVAGGWNNDNSVYEITVPQLAGVDHIFTGVIFARGSEGFSSLTTNCWNRTSNQEPEEYKNLFTVNNTADGSGHYGGAWSKYGYPAALVGDFNNWDPDANVFGDFNSNIGATFINLEDGESYGFKVLQGESYCGNTGTITSDISGWHFDKDANCTITSGEAGEYMFKWNKSTYYMTEVKYPKNRLTKQTYLYVDARNTNWADAAFAARYFYKYYDNGNDLPSGGTVTCTTPLETHVHYTLVPDNNYVGQVQVERKDPSNLEGDPWNRASTANANTRTSVKQNCLLTTNATDGTWNDFAMVWGTYCPPMSSASLSDNSTALVSWQTGDGSSANPYLVAASGTIKVIASATSAVNDANMTPMYDFKVSDNGASASSAQSGTGTTYDKGSLTTGHTYEISLDAWNSYNETNGTKNTSATHKWYKAVTLRNVTHTLAGVTLSSGESGTGAAADNEPYTATFAAATGYDLPATITVKFGSTTKTAGTDYTWNQATGVVSIFANKIDNNVTIKIDGVAQTYAITYKNGGNTDFTGVHIGSQPTSHTYNKATTLKSASKSGYVFGGWYDNSSCTGDALTSIGKTAKTADFTLYAQWTAMSLVDLVSGTLYTASDMVPAGVSLTSSYQYYPGVSADQRFNVIGTGAGSSSTGPMGAKNENNTFGGTAFTTVMGFDKDASPTDAVPAHHALQFKIPAAGQLEIWVNSNSNIFLSNGTTEYLVNAQYKILTVTAGTWYLYAKAGSKKLGGIRYKKTHSVSAATSTGDDSKGTVSAAKTTLAEDSSTVITAVPATGYQVTNWAVSGIGASISPSGSSSSTTTTLTMGTAIATVTVTFGAIDYTITHSASSNGSYTISVAGGDPTDENTTANYGQTITLAATPDDGYVLDSWTVTGATSDDAITVTSNQFTMPAEGVTVAATFVIPCTAVAAPTSLSCSAQTPNTLTYTWTEASNASGYTASLYSDSGCESLVSSQDLGNVATVTFTSLTASMTYYCKVQSKGNGSTYCENGGTTSAQSGTTTAPRIIYNANLDGTSGSTTDGTSTEGAKACGYSKSDYKFKWWNTAANGTGEDFYVGESVTLGGSDVNLYAQWEEVDSDEEFWVGDNFTFTDNVMSVGDMRLTKYNVDLNTDISKDYNQVSKYSSTAKKAKVMAMDAADEYLQVHFSDGSAINELHLGTVHNGTSDTKKVVVIYSTTADFSSGSSEKKEISINPYDQTSKEPFTDFSPSTEDTYRYARIYVSVSTAVYSYTGPSSGGASKMRIYALKAKKGAATFTVTYADGGADDGDVPEDNTEYAEGDEVTVLGNTGSLTKTEHTFGGWSDGVNTYDEYDTFTMPASDVTLTAVWIINQYNVAVASVDHVTITATPAGGSAISEGNNADVDYGKSVTLAYSSLESGNYWGGWKVTKNLDGSDVTASVVVGNTLTVPAYEVTVSAVTYGDVIAWCDPDITITGDIHLTSVNGVSVYATSTTSNLIRIQSSDLAHANKLEIKYLDADDGDAEVAKGSSLFRFCNDGTDNYNVADGSQIDVSASPTYDQTYSISYTPTSNNVVNHYKLQITMKQNTTVLKTVTHDLYGRSLPEEFVVASKFNGEWYALPNTLEATEGASKAVAGVRITVDNTTTPTAATYAPNVAVYRGEGRNNSAANRYGIRLTDGTNHLQVSTTGSNNKMWLSPTGSVNCQDWWLSSTNFGAYSVTIPSNTGNESKKIGMSGGNIGYYTSPTSPSGQIYFLPITNKYTDVPATATEWGQHSVVLAANPGATATKAQARIEGGSPTEDQTISAINAAMGTAKRVKVPVGDIDLADLANNEGKLLYINWYNSSSTLLGTSCVTIPRIIAANRNMKTDGEPLKNAWTDKEVHVLPGFTLTANTNDYATNPGTATIKELHIYPGATLNVSTGTLTAKTLRLHNGWTRAGEKQYNTARVYINATNHAALAKETASMDYDIYELTDGKHYYPLAVPFETAVSSIDYADSYLAGFSTYGTHYGIKAYDGARRAERGPDQANNWYLVEGDATLAPGKGYIMTAVAVKGEAIIRIPLTYNDAWTADGEKGTVSAVTKNVVEVVAHTGTAATANKSNAGWNLLGVPFMSCYSTNEEAMTDGTTTEFINGRLILTGDPSSPLAFDDKDENIYVNVPTHDFSEYLQTEIDEATLLPGWCFMVQIGTSGNLTFLTSAQAESSSTPIYAPRRERAEMPVEKTGIILSGGEASDRTTILVSDKYSAADYEINADLEKLFGNGYTLATYSLSGETRLAYNAMSTSDATAVIPIGYRAPAEGEYTFSINPRYAESGAFSRVDLIDYETGTVTNLLYGPYTFESDRTQNDARFALNVVMAPQTPTDIESISNEGLEMSGAHKMIIDEKLYIILDGKMYDATGKVVKGGQK